MRMRTIIVVAVPLVLTGWAVVAQQSKPAAVPPREFTSSIGMKFVRIDPGSFKMGSDSGYADEKPVHEVTLSKGFYLQATEVTQAQWEAVMGSNPSFFKGPERPVEVVSWEDAQEFLKKLNAKEKDTGYRLPSEAEWEYACRAGEQEPDIAPNLGEVAWWAANSGGETHPAGQKKPNAWGLYDMRGNVMEWVQDWDGPYSVERQVDPQGPQSGGSRVLRGATWRGVDSGTFRCACRSSVGPGLRGSNLGFRCARTVL
jgi:formylglycine-generating enzyme required for sulfatase activity